ncbi:ABC transporter permease [Rhodoplanes roseus]|nr:ABC transporter permease [Rhodoplanes roseus]
MRRLARLAPLAPLARIVPLLLFVAAWHLVGVAGLVDPAFLPPPGRVAVALVDLLRGGQIGDNIAVTLLRAFTGLALGATAGVWIGVMMARSEVFDAYAAPLVGATYSLPKSALVPLFILWFGIGSTTAICATFLACLLPVVVNTHHGVATTPKVLVWSAQAMGFSDREMLGRVFLMHALPDIMTGLRIALGFSFVLAISSEMIAANSGIGKLIFMYGENGTYDYMFAAITSVVAVAFSADRALLAVTHRILRWHDSAVPAADAA